LMREVSDSIHLRRFCRLGLTERVPDESTVRKLTRRLGPEVVHQLSREPHFPHYERVSTPGLCSGQGGVMSSSSRIRRWVWVSRSSSMPVWV
jgi:hypothetical protein